MRTAQDRADRVASRGQAEIAWSTHYTVDVRRRARREAKRLTVRAARRAWRSSSVEVAP